MRGKRKNGVFCHEEKEEYNRNEREAGEQGRERKWRRQERSGQNGMQLEQEGRSMKGIREE